MLTPNLEMRSLSSEFKFSLCDFEAQRAVPTPAMGDARAGGEGSAEACCELQTQPRPSETGDKVSLGGPLTAGRSDEWEQAPRDVTLQGPVGPLFPKMAFPASIYSLGPGV